MKMDELKEEPKPEVEEAFEGEDLEDQVMEDLREAFDLLKRSMHMLDYFADSEMRNPVAKREQTAMGKLAEKISGYLDATIQHYED